MKKKNRILYWIVTIFLAVGMLAGGIQQMLQTGGYVDIVGELGYPLYVLSIIGAWKVLGVVAILVPKAPVLKEWAYAGFFFVMSGAAVSHLANGEPLIEAVPSLVLLAATILSWHLRPGDRKLHSIHPINHAYEPGR